MPDLDLFVFGRLRGVDAAGQKATTVSFQFFPAARALLVDKQLE